MIDLISSLKLIDMLLICVTIFLRDLSNRWTRLSKILVSDDRIALIERKERLDRSRFFLRQILNNTFTDDTFGKRLVIVKSGSLLSKTSKSNLCETFP